jgi:hypothetical protein
VSTLRDEGLGFRLRQGQMYLCPRQHSERMWWPRPHNLWAPGFRTPAWRGFGLMLNTNTHSTSRSRKHGAMSPLSLIIFHDVLLGWTSGGPLLVCHWLQTTAVRYAYLCSSQFSPWTADFFYSSTDIRQVLKSVKYELLNSIEFIFPVVLWQPSLCYRCVANSWLCKQCSS